VKYIFQTTSGNDYYDWQNLGGWSKDIEVAKNADGRLEVFAIGSDNQVYHIWQITPGGGWSGWAGIPGGIGYKEIDVGRNLDGQLEVFAVGVDNFVYTSWQRDGWNGWKPLGGQSKDIAVGQNADGRLEIFRIGTGNDLSHKWQNSPNGAAGWSGWDGLGGGPYDFGNE